MRGELFGNPDVVAREIQGRFSAERDRIVTPPKFGAVCKLLWPDKTAAHLAALTGRDERTAKRWLSGEFEPPVSVAGPLLHEIFKRE